MNETKTYQKYKNKAQNNYPKWIIIHHSGGTDLNPLLDTSHHTAQIMENYHISLGWGGLGYHYVIHKNGDVWKGRPEHYWGAHAIGKNNESIGICLAGNFDATLPTKEQENALAGLIREIRGRYNIPLENIVPHRKFAVKTCFGKLLKDDWARKLVEISPITPSTPNKQEIKNKITELLNQL